MVEIELGGKKRELMFDLGIMSDYEDLTGDNAIMDNLFENLTAKKLMAMLFCILKVNDSQITIDECGKMVNESNMANVILKLGEAWQGGKPKPDGKKKS